MRYRARCLRPERGCRSGGDRACKCNGCNQSPRQSAISDPLILPHYRSPLRKGLRIRKRPAPAWLRAPGEVVLRQCAWARSRTDGRLQKWSGYGCYVFVNPASAHVSSVAELLVRCCSKCVSPDPSALPPGSPGRSSSEFLPSVQAWLLQDCSQKTDHI
jgi:hypothetical protein